MPHPFQHPSVFINLLVYQYYNRKQQLNIHRLLYWDRYNKQTPCVRQSCNASEIQLRAAHYYNILAAQYLPYSTYRIVLTV